MPCWAFYVFDISQTSGVDLPNLHEIKGEPGEGFERLAAFLKCCCIQVSYNANIAPALGMSYGGRIAILPGQSKAEEFSTLVHEAAHELHKAERRTATTKTVRETEAVAFVVGKAVGQVNDSAPADYIQLYHGNASLLAESLEIIQQTAGVLLSALEPPLNSEAATDAQPAEGRHEDRARTPPSRWRLASQPLPQNPQSTLYGAGHWTAPLTRG